MHTLRILVAEDHAIIAMLLSEMLVAMGHDVCAVAGTEVEAVAAAARCKPDLMIADIRLADGSGIAAVRSILRSGPLPHLYISGSIVEHRSPAMVVLQKPFREDQLAEAIALALAAVPGTQADTATGPALHSD